MLSRVTAVNDNNNNSFFSIVQVEILILGCGPTGLGAATRLHQHGKHDWILLDQVGLMVADMVGLFCFS